MVTSVRCVAVIGKQNSPLYVKNYTPETPDLAYHYIIYTVLDVMEEKGRERNRELYYGLLYALEDMAVYGYVTNTNIKFIVVLGLTESAIKDADLRPLMRRMHLAYIALVSDPYFSFEAKKITNVHFDKTVDGIVQEFSRH